MTQTHFGYKTVQEEEKVHKVAEVFHSVASKYDVMNDLMSAACTASGRPSRLPRRPCGRASRCSTSPAAPATWPGIRQAGRSDRRSRGTPTSMNPCCAWAATGCSTTGCRCPTLLCDAEKLPFPDNYFDRGQRGLRPAQHDAQGCGAGGNAARAQAGRQAAGAGVLESRGAAEEAVRLVFVHGAAAGWASASPAMPKATATWPNRSACIPDQETLKTMMQDAGFEHVEYHNLTAGVVALHTGIKL